MTKNRSDFFHAHLSVSTMSRRFAVLNVVLIIRRFIIDIQKEISVTPVWLSHRIRTLHAKVASKSFIMILQRFLSTKGL